MFVCLCTGATTQVVNNAILGGASTSNEVAAACGAGSVCGRCRCTLRALIEAHPAERPPAVGKTVTPDPAIISQAPGDIIDGDDPS
jgi:bacterioferritin-associated ferredoxin